MSFRSLAAAGAAWLLVALMLLLSPLPARAAPLPTLRTQDLPAVPGEVIGFAASGESLLAFGRHGAWQLDAARSGWSALPWRPPAPLLGVVGRGPESYLLIGASNAVERIARVDSGIDGFATRELPPLPEALRQPRGTLLGAALLITGIAADGAPRLLRIEPLLAAPAWTALPLWPNGGAASTLVGQTGALFVSVPASPGDSVWRWSADGGWQARTPAPGAILPGAARATGQAHLLYLLRTTPDAAPQPMTLHTITNAWAALPPAQIHSVQVSAPWRNGLVYSRAAPSGGETAVGIIEIEAGKLLLKWLDWIVIVVYLVGMLGIGLYFYLREKRQSTAEFFVGGRSIPFWAAGVSLYAANTSSISYIAIPAKAFETNWQYLTNNLVAVIGLMFVAVWIVPLLRRLDLMSVFSYLETRFHPAIRMLSSALCILVQLGSRMSVILFLPSLAIATITGIDVVWSVLMMGGFTIVYTAMGGMKAVVWTDVVQLVVKMGGALFAIGFMVFALDGGVGEFVRTAAAENKTKLFDFSFDLTKATVWGFIFLVLFDVVLTFPKDQVLMQRTLSTKNDKDAGRSIWAFAAIMIPGGFVFYSIGTALFVYYKNHPERMNPLLGIDATFPLFIAAELPMGITGLIIAGIFAAAMATLSSIMNSVSTLASVDFYEKLVKHPTPRKSVLFAEIMTVVAGLIGIGFALVLSRYDIHSLFDVSIELAGLLGGGFAGAYTLGMFTRRANAQGVAIGIAGSIVLTTIAWWFKLVHPYFYLAISILLCIVIGYAASWLFPRPKVSLKGLTIYRDA
ncbi:sodium:solute symporter [Aquincola sp. S2]|uniref:Sodium:solute symporter n=1 Tax=Pseudaquabacterium terrae TaxID=2732868 RepID=A0ABX2E9W9_9BURK|nr:sodium:solute symporter [Aquabacterium terrae]NRF65825.1 sodium:solute symporter [Aquabacterium terrae]